MFLVTQSIIVYGLMIWAMTYFGKIAYKAQYPQGIGGRDMFQNRTILFPTMLAKSYYYIPILVFCILAALRFKVGVDCETYKEGFYHFLRYGSLKRDTAEVGFAILTRFSILFSNSHYLFFFTLAFLQISFLYYALRKMNYATIYLGVSIMLCGTFFSFMNGIRQNIAACMLVAAIPLIQERKNWIWYVVITILAASMHKSAYLFIPIGLLSYFLLKKGILNIYLQLTIIAVCYLLMDKIEIPFLEVLFSYGEHAGYDSSAIEDYANLDSMTKNFGLSSWLILITQIIPIIYCTRTKELIDNKIFNIMYNLFFIGSCISLMFYNNFTIGRLNYYFKIFYPIILSITLFTLSTSRRKIDKQMFWVTILIMVTNLSYVLYKSSIAFPEEYSLYKFDLFQN